MVGGGNHRGVERARQKAKKELRKILEQGLGVFIPHPEIRVDRPELYRKDGVHLSEAGLKIFLFNLWQGLIFALAVGVGALA